MRVENTIYLIEEIIIDRPLRFWQNNNNKKTHRITMDFSGIYSDSCLDFRNFTMYNGILIRTWSSYP